MARGHVCVVLLTGCLGVFPSMVFAERRGELSAVGGVQYRPVDGEHRGNPGEHPLQASVCYPT